MWDTGRQDARIQSSVRRRSGRVALNRLGFAIVGLAAIGFATAVQAAPLTPNSGALQATGSVTDGSGQQGQFAVRATLKGGNFTGSGRLTIGGQTVDGALIPGRSYLENGQCHFYFESGRSRAEVGGRCDSTTLTGKYEAFIPGEGLQLGTMTGRIALGTPSAAAPDAGSLPTGKLTCAYNDRRLAAGFGETTQYSVAFSNMVSLTLNPAGTYVAGSGGGGRFVRSGDRIRLTTGTWAGAVGVLEPDRSGAPAVVFRLDENRRPNGVHIVDPQTTRCTKAR